MYIIKNKKSETIKMFNTFKRKEDKDYCTFT